MARFSIGNFFGKKTVSDIQMPPVTSEFRSITDTHQGGWNPSAMIPFDGEKTPLELGTPFDFYIDYYSMRKRAWELFLMSDIVQNAVEKYCLWMVGSGLKLQADPQYDILQRSGFDVDVKQLITDIESRFRLHGNTKNSTHSRNMTLHHSAVEALKNALISGDVLCVVRYEKKRQTIELIDGCYISTPLDKIGNDKIKQGVEVDDTGNHIAFHVRTKGLEWKRVPAYNSLGQQTAWLMYGRRHKIDDVRGMSLFSAIMETVSKLDRYKDATVGAAEENSKIPYTIEHDQHSDGQNPLINQVAQSFGKGNGTAPETKTLDPDVLASKVAQTTSKQTYNMPVGSKLVRHSYDADIGFKDFFMPNLDIVYATIGIPAEVALDKFEGSYSSSRAALKSWEYNLAVKRKNILKDYFYKPFYDFWLDIEVLSNNIDIPGYLDAFNKDDYMLLESYRDCRFVGASVPHIDPLKEVLAERKKLGTNFDSIPLTTAEQSCENLNSGDFYSVINKASDEKEHSKDFPPVATPYVRSRTTEIPGTTGAVAE
jgi:hypothetical protein